MLHIQPFNILRSIFTRTDQRGKPSQLQMPKGLENFAKMLADPFDIYASWYGSKMSLMRDRYQLYNEYDLMDEDDMIVSVLDLYAEDATQRDMSSNKTIWFESESAEVEKIGNAMLEDIGTEDKIFSIARELVKYGDSFSALLQTITDQGMPGKVVGVIPANPHVMSRIEDTKGTLTGFRVAPIAQSVQYMDKTSKNTDQAPDIDPPWCFVHFRLLGKDRRNMYGSSFLLPARRPYRRFRMAEDALVLYRLKRAPDRLVLSVKGLDGMSPEDRATAIRRIRQELRKNAGIDTSTDQTKQDVNPLSVDEDLIVDESAISVTKLNGSSQVNGVTDVDFIRKRLFGALKVPADYMGFDDAKSGWVSNTTLSYQDINFARMEKRLQTSIMEGFSLMLQINLSWQGIDPSAPGNRFTVHMNPVSALDETQRLEVEKVRLDTINILNEIGKSLGLETEEWRAYILSRSRIPTHLLRKNGTGEVSTILKGEIPVESKTISEAKEIEINSLLESKLEPDAKHALYDAITKIPSLFSTNAIPNTFKSQNSLSVTERNLMERILTERQLPIEGRTYTPIEDKANLMRATVSYLTEGKKKSEEGETGDE